MRYMLYAALLCLPVLAWVALDRTEEEWEPPGPVTLMVGFMEESAADTETRLIAEAIEETTGWAMDPMHVTDNRGGQNITHMLSSAKGDGTILGVMRTETLGYNMTAIKGTDYTLDDFTPLATISRFQMAITAMADSDLKDWADVVKASRQGEPLRFGAMSPKLVEIAYLLGKEHDIEFDFEMMRGEQAVMEALEAGDLDLGWTAGAQAEAVAEERMIVLASGLPERLDMAPDAPTVRELGSSYDADGYFMFVAPGTLSDDARDALSDAIAEVMADDDTRAAVEETFGEPVIMAGEDLDIYLRKSERKALGLMEEASDMEALEDYAAVAEYP